MNFRIIENGPSSWDKEEELIKLYKEGVPVSKIREILSISGPTFNKMVKQFKEEGKIIPRRKTYHRKKNKKPSPKYYQRQWNRSGFQIVRRGKYYGYVKTRRQAERFVELMEECDWDMNMREEVKRRVISGE